MVSWVNLSFALAYRTEILKKKGKKIFVFWRKKIINIWGGKMSKC